ncbi:Membrane protein involved in the export of O-antigen and teichoic acid [Sphingomonas sp. OV641]|nr:Membrane protein involved in the export of O-antigen and teichoic acid [Sphingomonas sp. OV641]
MLVATIARMGLGLLTFVVLARYLGPTQFGVIATAMAYATFVSLATDYGLATSALRRASIAPPDAGRIVGDALAVKVLLALAALLVAIIAAAFAVPVTQLPIYACVFMGTLAYSFADLSMVVARAHRRFEVEAALVVSTSVVMLLGTGGVAAWTGSVSAAAGVFLATRLFYLAAVQWRLRCWLGPLAGMGRSVAEMRATLHASANYAVDNILTVLTSQIDVLLFALLLSSYEMGVYQAGARLVQVIVPFAVVLSTVYMPALSSAAAQPELKPFRRLSRRVTIEFAGLALVAGLAFTFVGPLITTHLYGDRYASLQPLWAGFGAYALLRFAAAGFGIQLVALNRITPRIVSQIAAAAAFVVATVLLLPGAHLRVAAWLLALIGAVNFAVLGLSLLRSDRRDTAVIASLVGLPLTALLLALLAGRM